MQLKEILQLVAKYNICCDELIITLPFDKSYLFFVIFVDLLRPYKALNVKPLLVTQVHFYAIKDK